jgi:hypothetical protein
MAGRRIGRIVWRLRRARGDRPDRPACLPPLPHPAEPPDGRLAAAERTALEQLGVVDGYATRWPVGREVARSLTDRQLVVAASDYVLLTRAGRRALGADARPRG